MGNWWEVKHGDNYEWKANNKEMKLNFKDPINLRKIVIIQKFLKSIIVKNSINKKSQKNN